MSKTFTLKSSDLGGQATEQEIFNGFGYEGKNISPQLSWENIPQETKSFAVTVFDPDAPTGSGWWHWLIFNIPANCNELKSNAGAIELDLAPKSCIQSLTDFGTLGYSGPCPPKGHGIHQYLITIYALKTERLDCNESTPPAQVSMNLWANTIQKASIVMYFGSK